MRKIEKLPPKLKKFIFSASIRTLLSSFLTNQGDLFYFFFLLQRVPSNEDKSKRRFGILPRSSKTKEKDKKVPSHLHFCIDLKQRYFIGRNFVGKNRFVMKFLPTNIFFAGEIFHRRILFTEENFHQRNFYR